MVSNKPSSGSPDQNARSNRAASLRALRYWISFWTMIDQDQKDAMISMIITSFTVSVARANRPHMEKSISCANASVSASIFPAHFCAVYTACCLKGPVFKAPFRLNLAKCKSES